MGDGGEREYPQATVPTKVSGSRMKGKNDFPSKFDLDEDRMHNDAAFYVQDTLEAQEEQW